jgi:hypothetical protein
MREEFREKLEAFLIGAQAIRKAYWAKCGYSGEPEEISAQWLQKRVRVVTMEGGKPASAFCFVDFETGDILKSAGWSAPAKGARGNIFDESNGLGRIGPYGPAYNR